MGLRYPIGKYVQKGMMNSEVKAFVVGWVVQNEEDTCLWGVVEDCMAPLGVVGKGRICCRLVLKLQKGMDIGQP